MTASNGTFVSSNRTAGCIGIRVMSLLRRRYADTLAGLWNRPIALGDVVYQPIGRAGFDSLSVENERDGYRWQLGSMIVAGLELPTIQTCWTTHAERFQPFEWLCKFHPEPLVLFGDGPMFSDRSLELAFVADLC